LRALVITDDATELNDVLPTRQYFDFHHPTLSAAPRLARVIVAAAGS
jgi:hypothetical protein